MDDENLPLRSGPGEVEDVTRSSAKTVKKAPPKERRSGLDRRSAPDRREMPRPEGRRTSGGRRANDPQDI